MRTARRMLKLVCFVDLVDLVHLVSFVSPNKREKPDKPNNGLLALADFFSILLADSWILQKEDISRWLIPNPTLYMSSIHG